MKALAKLKAEKGIWLHDVAVPKITNNDVLIKIRKTAICGTDLHIYQWNEWAQKNIPIGLTVGHECVGEVVDCGSNVQELIKIGTRVSIEGHIFCGYCRNCLDGKRHFCSRVKGIGVNSPGAFAEYISVPYSNVYPVPGDISDDIASIFDPLGNAIHTTLAFNLVSEDVLVTGAGPIGIMAALIAQAVGAHCVVITDMNDYRLNLAKKLGVQHVLHAEKDDLSHLMQSLNIHEGFGIGLEMSGNQTAMNVMFHMMRNGGKIASLGLLSSQAVVNWEHVIFKGLSIRGIYGREIFGTWHKMTRLLQGGLQLNDVITHYYSVDDYEQAFQLLETGQSGKVVLNW